jgi:hypothetical protein
MSYGGKVIDYQDIPRLLAAAGKDRRWLAKQLRLSDNTIRQYLGPKGKRTAEFMEDIERVLRLEEARQHEDKADAPPWNRIFRTADEFDLADRASRMLKSESFTDFCRGAILMRAQQIIEEKDRSVYPKGHKISGPLSKVADKRKK